jgi:hypothetical protein
MVGFAIFYKFNKKLCARTIFEKIFVCVHSFENIFPNFTKQTTPASTDHKFIFLRKFN